MRSFIRSATALVAVLFLSTAASFAQTASVTVTISPPAPAPFTIPVSQQVTLNGVTYNVTGTLTLTPTTAPVPTPTPTHTPGTGTITRLTDTAGATVTTIAAGSTLVIVGTNLGGYGTATVAGLPAQVTEWTTLYVKVKVPPTGNTGTATGPVVLTRGDGSGVLTSPTSLTITAETAELPPPSEDYPDPVFVENPNLYDDYIFQTEPPDYQFGDPYPVVYAIMDDQHVPVEDAEPVESLLISGDWFGDIRGEVQLDYTRAEILSWTNTEIKARKLQGKSADHVTVLVRTAEHRDWQGSLPSD